MKVQLVMWTEVRLGVPGRVDGARPRDAAAPREPAGPAERGTYRRQRGQEARV